MTTRRMGSLALTVLAGLLCCWVSAYGARSAHSIDFRFNPVLSILYCALPILSFPVFLLSLIVPRIAALQIVLAIAWLPVYSALNWRTCSSFGYCAGVASTVLATLVIPEVLAYFGAAICNVAASALRPPPRMPVGVNHPV
jgi:hypothetical protein